MTSRIIVMLLVLVINVSVFVSFADTSCVEDLMSLIDVFKTNKTSTDNVLHIRQTFYPQNKTTPHYVIVHYCYEEPCNNDDTANYTYIWTDNPIFFVIDYHFFNALTFELADLGDIGELSLVIPQFCNNNEKELLQALTSQLKSIEGTDTNFYYARNFDDLLRSQNHDYDTAKKVIGTWLLITTCGCICVAHVLMWFKGTREQLGKLPGRFAEKNVSTMDNEHSSISQSKANCKKYSPPSSKPEYTLFFLIQTVFFPIMTFATIGVTVIDIILYCRYRRSSLNFDQNFLYLFPLPVIVPAFFLFNLGMSVLTITILIKIHKDGMKKSDDKSKDREKNSTDQSDSLKQFCEYSLIFATLVSLFGIVYLVYHGFWIIIALLAYPGRILIGGSFVVPAILVTIPIWIIVKNISDSWYTAYKDNNTLNKCCQQSSTVSQQQKGHEMINNKEARNDKDKQILTSWWIGSGWLAFLIFDIIFWTFFLLILYHVSKFLLDSVIIEGQTFELITSFVTINAVSGALLWINTYLVTYKMDSEESTKRDTLLEIAKLLKNISLIVNISQTFEEEIEQELLDSSKV